MKQNQYQYTGNSQAIGKQHRWGKTRIKDQVTRNRRSKAWQLTQCKLLFPSVCDQYDGACKHDRVCTDWEFYFAADMLVGWYVFWELYEMLIPTLKWHLCGFSDVLISGFSLFSPIFSTSKKHSSRVITKVTLIVNEGANELL